MDSSSGTYIAIRTYVLTYKCLVNESVRKVTIIIVSPSNVWFHILYIYIYFLCKVHPPHHQILYGTYSGQKLIYMPLYNLCFIFATAIVP